MHIGFLSYDRLVLKCLQSKSTPIFRARLYSTHVLSHGGGGSGGGEAFHAVDVPATTSGGAEARGRGRRGGVHDRREQLQGAVNRSPAAKNEVGRLRKGYLM